MLFIALAVAVCLGYLSYTWLKPPLDNLAYGINTLMGAGLASVLVGALPKYIMPAFGKSLEKMEEMMAAVSNLSLFPKMAMKESWKTTKEAVETVDKKSMELIANLAFLLFFALTAGVSFTAFEAASPEPVMLLPPPPVQEKSSYVFVGNMPWIVGNIQSFFSSAVVFPRDATPEDLNGGGEDALSLNDRDERFYQAVYKPLFADLARCGTPGKR